MKGFYYILRLIEKEAISVEEYAPAIDVARVTSNVNTGLGDMVILRVYDPTSKS